MICFASRRVCRYVTSLCSRSCLASTSASLFDSTFRTAIKYSASSSAVRRVSVHRVQLSIFCSSRPPTCSSRVWHRRRRRAISLLFSVVSVERDWHSVVSCARPCDADTLAVSCCARSTSYWRSWSNMCHSMKGPDTAIFIQRAMTLCDAFMSSCCRTTHELHCTNAVDKLILRHLRTILLPLRLSWKDARYAFFQRLKAGLLSVLDQRRRT
mmetsp:Transcript_41034/g.66066  ORF Transcript_41034/g.66066 Transcript_41034/m.66066 type:complete len:212 (-) Transcript_41034:2759-3394(-)